jgi:hypothetical protein
MPKAIRMTPIEIEAIPQVLNFFDFELNQQHIFVLLESL